MSRRLLSIILILLIATMCCAAYTVDLAPVSPGEVGSWAEISLPLRLHPNPRTDVRYEGPDLALSLWGEITLGTSTYPLLLGIRPGGEARLWLDATRSGRIGPEDELVSGRGNGYVYWSTELVATPEKSDPFTYPIAFRWPEGRGYLFLIGGNPQRGTLELDDRSLTVVLVDADITGEYGSEGDFYAVDWDGDGVIHAERGDHERFAIHEAFTLGETSYAPDHISPDGTSMEFTPASYVPPKHPLVPGHPAPAFAFEDYLSGEEIALSDLSGQVVLIDFWATWCPPCMDTLPDIVALYDRYSDRGFELIGVSLDTDESSLRQVLLGHEIRWPQAFDGLGWDTSIAQLYRVTAIPALFLLDHEGNIRRRDVHGEDLESAVAKLVAERVSATDPEPLNPQPERGPILTLLAQEKSQVDRDGTVSAILVLENTSRRAAQDIRIALADKDSPHSIHPDTIDVLHPGEQRTVQLQLDPMRVTAPLERDVHLSLSYRYGVADTWTDVLQEETVPMTVRPAAREPEGRRPAWALWVLAGLSAAALLALVLLR